MRIKGRRTQGKGRLRERGSIERGIKGKEIMGKEVKRKRLLREERIK